jgi:4-amino-4-deoxy-L-arabinose transferase-like glycosyltransferase
MANTGNALRNGESWVTRTNRSAYAAVLIVACAIYLACIFSPPPLFDDVDSVHAQMARTMVTSGDWVTMRLDGIPYLEKAPMLYWTIAILYKLFGVHDWVARVPIVLSVLGLVWLTAAFGVWAFGKRAGFYAGLCMATCVGLFLFTRILIPDVMLTFTIALGLWAFLRALEEDEPHPRLWAFVLAASIGVGLLLKSLIGAVFPVAAGVIYLLSTKQFFAARTWKRLRPISGFFIILVIAAPWHVLATRRNPPGFAWTLHAGPGQYHGFLWFYFVNEQLLRFLNLRYPRDYDTVPRLYFWLFHLVWLFPWSVYLPAIAKLSFKPIDRAGRTRLLALCWAGFVLVFFTFSTTQEYYSMPCYPALALLLGCAIATGGDWVRRGTRALAAVCACATVAALAILFLVRGVPTPGDISDALIRHPKLYTLSLGHMGDLTLPAFAYLRLPLALAALAFLIGALGAIRSRSERAFLATALMMIVFFHAARLAVIVFDPILSSRQFAEALLKAPAGKFIEDRHYYAFSSVIFYANCDSLLLNARRLNMEYGADAPGSPPIFIDDSQWKALWLTSDRYYLAAYQVELPRFEALVGRDRLHAVATSGGKMLVTNYPP